MKVVQGAIIGMLVLGLASCSNELPDMLHTSWNADSLELRVQDDLLKETKELTVWSYFDMTGMNEQFRERYPSVRFSYKQIAHEQFAEAYAEAPYCRRSPDVLVIDNEFAGISVPWAMRSTICWSPCIQPKRMNVGYPAI